MSWTSFKLGGFWLGIWPEYVAVISPDGAEHTIYVPERTCENLAKPEDAGDSPFHCSECGARSSYGDGTFHIGESSTLNGKLMLADAWHVWRYCPSCGAKVIEK